MRALRVACLSLIGPACLLCGCTTNGAQDVPEAEGAPGLLEIPLATFSDGHPWKTDLGSNFGFYLGPEEQRPKAPAERPKIRHVLGWEDGNPFLSLGFSGLKPPDHFAGSWLGVFGSTQEPRVVLPAGIGQRLRAVRFRARAPDAPVHFKLEAKTPGGMRDQRFDATAEWQTFTMPLPESAVRSGGGAFATQALRELAFVIESRLQPGRADAARSGLLELDDVCLICDGERPFRPPQTEDELLQWVRDRCLHYFIWNYREPAGGRGIVLERNSFHDLVSVSGIGYAFPALIIAENEGLLSADEARSRALGLLRWLDALDCSSGTGGWHGFPYHFLKPDGTRAGASEVGTIDWAICAAGIRVAGQHYAGDGEIEPLATGLLARPDWQTAVGDSGRIAHGFNGDGKLLDAEWGSAFTEEAYLVALEAVASGDLGSEVFGELAREVRDGFWPSWFGSGFTYDWLQLWTGPREPFSTNSRRAYQADAELCAKRYGRPVMGLTACETFSGVDENGFLKWDTYAGETGSDVHLAGEAGIDRRSVCPYGAALALPFVREKAVAALFEYVKLGFVHPLLGLPDSVRLEDLPQGAEGPVPNWTQFAIDVGPMWMAIEACRPSGGRVAELYLTDGDVKDALEQLDASLAGWEKELKP